MDKRSADEIVQSIAHVTGHADRELLEASLISTLYELMDVERVALYKVFYEYNQPECYLTIEVADDRANFYSIGEAVLHESNESLPGLKSCLEQKHSIKVSDGNGRCTYLYPVVNHLGVIVSIFMLTGGDLKCEENEKFVGGFFQIYRNYLRLLDESEHDTLTGLLNRRTFDRDLKRVLAEWHKDRDVPQAENELPLRRMARAGKANWLAVIDIDHFKRINDRYGHLYGDEVLLLLSNIMRESFRGYDKLFRFGGEEFVVILRSTDLAGAEKALQRFVESVEHYKFPQIGVVTVSVGYVEIASQQIPAEVLSHADEALYYAKEHGRNQLCRYEQLVDEGKITPPNRPQGGDAELF